MFARQRGVTLLELLLSLSILAGVVAAVARFASDATEESRTSLTALHARTVGQAASEYIKDNYAAISSIATASTPVLIRVPELIATGYLPAGYSVTNPRQQAACVLVLEPTPNRLSGLLVTEGGDSIDDLTLGQVAASIGGAGGAIYSTEPGVVRGAMGGFNFAFGSYANANHVNGRCDGSVGSIALMPGHPVMALWYADTAQGASTLYRDQVPGNPSLNTMNTPILMGTGSHQVVGTACTTSGAIASSASGAVLACENGEWKPGGSAFWQDPVPTYANLPTCNAASLGHTRVVHTPAVGSERRAYTCDGGGTWVALGVDNNGNLTVPATVTASRGRFSRDAIAPIADGTIALSENTAVTGRRAGIALHNGGVSAGSIELASSGSRRTVFSDTLGLGLGIEATGNIQTQGYLQVDGVSVEGAACPTPGLIGRDATGGVLSCKSGLWSLPKAALSCITVGSASANAAGVQCPVGRTMTGGGCDGGVTDHYNTSVPSGNGWYCANWKYQGKTVRAYAVCCGS